MQRLKCESDIIRRALANLPATLQETYDRILLNLHTEDRLVVRCFFEWIRFYSGLYGHGIPCQKLVQVAERCISKPNGFQSGYFYDEETIKELYSCLIKVSPRKLSYEPTFETPTVNFAHYTVREYFDSGGLWRGPVAQPATAESFSMQQPLQVVFEEVYRLDLNAAGVQNIASVDPSDLLGAIHADFNISCTMTALLALLYEADNIAQQENLFHLAVGLFDPLGAWFGFFCTVAKKLGEESKWLSSHGSCPGRFWTIRCIRDGSSSAMQLLYLMAFFGCEESAPRLVTRFVEMIGIRQLTQEQLRFHARIFMISDWSEEYIFDGSILEAAAQGAILDWHGFDFQQLFNLSRDTMDPSKVLSLFVGGSNVVGLDSLLECGADPNTRSQRVTPLQIAVFASAFGTASTLLGAGADPNEAGNSAEGPWEERSIMYPYNELFGASPLYINRYLYDEESIRAVKSSDEAYGNIEALLLQHGAKSFLRPESALILRS